MSKLPSYMNEDESLYVLESVVIFLYKSEQNNSKRKILDAYISESNSQYKLQNVDKEIITNEGIIKLRNGGYNENINHIGNAHFCNDILSAIPICDSFLYDEVIQRCNISIFTNQYQLFGILPKNILEGYLYNLDEEEMFDCFLRPDVRIGVANVINLYHNIKHYGLETLVRSSYSNIMFFLEKAEELLIDTITIKHGGHSLPQLLQKQRWALKDKVTLENVNEEILFSSILLEMSIYLSELDLRKNLKDLRDPKVTKTIPSGVSINPLD